MLRVESNYPDYGHVRNGYQVSRRIEVKWKAECYEIVDCHYIQFALQHSSMFAQLPDHQVKLVVFECRGDGPPKSYRKRHVTSPKVALVTLSSGPEQLQEAVDQGLPPPAVTRIQLSQRQVEDLRTCRTDGAGDGDGDRPAASEGGGGAHSSHKPLRPYLLTFAGKHRPNSPREELVKLHNTRDVVLVETSDLPKHFGPNKTFVDVIKESLFCATPVGQPLLIPLHGSAGSGIHPRRAVGRVGTAAPAGAGGTGPNAPSSFPSAKYRHGVELARDFTRAKVPHATSVLRH